MTKSNKSSVSFLCFALFLVAALAITPAAGQAPAQSAAKPLDKKTILQRALQTYYILGDQGLKSFQCVVQPDWKKFMDSQEPASPDDPRLALLLPVQYSVVVDEQGNPTITPIRPTGGTPDSSVDGMVAGAQRAILGFLQSWNSIVLSSIFSPSEEGNYTLLDQPDGYKLTEIAGEQHIEISLTKDFMFTAMHSTAPGVVISINPKFTKIDKGLLLMTGFDYDINYGSQKVNVQIQYQTLEGFQMPGKVSYQVTFSGQTVPMDLNFSKYQLTKR